MDTIVSKSLAHLLPALFFSETPQERLLALGKILIKLPSVPQEERAELQQWLRSNFHGESILLAQWFATQPLGYVFGCLFEDTPIEQIADRMLETR